MSNSSLSALGLGPQIFVLLMNARENVFTLSCDQPRQVREARGRTALHSAAMTLSQAINFAEGSTLKGDAGKSINSAASVAALAA